MAKEKISKLEERAEETIQRKKETKQDCGNRGKAWREIYGLRCIYFL
jgi:hypothetical protein